MVGLGGGRGEKREGGEEEERRRVSERGRTESLLVFLPRINKPFLPADGWAALRFRVAMGVR